MNSSRSHQHHDEPGEGAASSSGASGSHGGHRSHHAHMVADFRRRFWFSLALTLPVLGLAEMIQRTLGIERALDFPGDSFVEFGFASAIYFYGGWPFLAGLFRELKDKRPGMMTLIALAISVAYVYSTLVVFGLPGQVFFWETATLSTSCCSDIGSRCAR